MGEKTDGFGLGTAWEEEIHSRIHRMIEEKVIWGASYAFVGEKLGKLFYRGVQGAFEPYSGRALEPGMYYDLASLTKAVGTASRALQLVQSGDLRLDTPAGEVLKGFHFPDITVGSLLMHNSGLPAEIAGKERITAENILDLLYETSAEAGCGERFVYSDVGFILLGLVIQKVDGMDLEESFQTHIFGPLNMRDTSYGAGRPKELYIPTECTLKRGCICGEAHDSKAWTLGQSGSAGLFSTLADLTVFVRRFLCRDEKLFCRGIYELLCSAESMGRTYGWSREYGPGTLYHTGFTGTSILMDMERREGFILLTNRIHPSRDNREFLDRRRELNNIFTARTSER